MRIIQLFIFFALICLTAKTALAGTPLKVISAMPEGEVETITQITVRFSENMRALGAMEDTPATAPLKLSVNDGALPPGNFRWLDPSTLSYLLDAPLDSSLAAPIEIKATVPAGTRALSGNTLPKDHSWTLNTAPLTLSLKVYPLLLKHSQFEIYSNYPLDLGALRKNLSATLDKKKIDLSFSEEIEPYHWQAGRQAAWCYLFFIDDVLPFDKTLEINLGAGIRAKAGGAPAKRQKLYAATPSSLKLMKWYAGERDNAAEMRPDEDLYITFNNPVEYKGLLSGLNITPRPEQVVEFPENGRAKNIRLPYKWAPQTKYEISIESGLKDVYGSTLARQSEFTIKTTDYTPLFHMEGGRQALESSLGGQFPLILRNMDQVYVELQYIPWSNERFPLVWYDNISFDEARQIPGVTVKNMLLDFSDRRNQNIRHILDIPGLLGFSRAEDVRGIVLMRLNATDSDGKVFRINSPGKPSANLIISDLGLTYKQGRDSGLVWVTSISGGQPLEGVSIKIIGENGKVLWTGKTDSGGIVETPGRVELPVGDNGFLVAEKGASTGGLPIRDTGLSAGDNYAYLLRNRGANAYWNAHAISQLPLYQPGQTVRFTVYLKKFGDTANGKALAVPDWQPLADEKAQFRILDARWKEVHAFSGSTNKYGSIAGEFALGESAALGQYYIEVTADSLQNPKTFTLTRVASFRPPEFKVDLDAPPSRPALLPQDAPLESGLSAGYFSGAVLAEADSSLEVRRNVIRHVPQRLNGFKTGYDIHHPFRARYYPGMGYDRGESYTIHGKLDAVGKHVYTLPQMPIAPGKTEQVSLTATVTDSTGLTSQGSAAFILHPSAAYVGIRNPFFAPAGREFTVELKTAAWDNAVIKNAAVTLTAEKNVDNNPVQVWSKTVAAGGELGTKIPVSFPDGGVYTLSASITDSEGRTNISRNSIFIAGPGLETLRLQPGSMLELIADEESYSPGSTAKVFCASPFENAVALITTERQGVFSHRVEKVQGTSPSFEIPLSDADAPYVFVTVTLISGRNAEPPRVFKEDDGRSDQDAGAPQLRYGTLCLNVADPAPKALNVSISTDKKEYRPGGKVKARVEVKNQDGKAARAQITMLAVDDRVLRASGEDMTGYQPSLSFKLINSYDFENSSLYRMLINLNLPGMLRLRNARMQGPIAAMALEPKQDSKAKSNAQERTDIRGNFSPMAYWLAAGETDRKGRLEVEFTLPDTLTSYRIVAVAADTGSLFKEEQASVTARKPLQLVSALPRFACEGDRLEGRILVQNLSAQRQNITVTAKGRDLVLEADSRNISLDAGASGTVSFPLRFEGAGQASLQVSGSMGKEKDSAVFSIPVKAVRPLTTVAAAGLLRQGQLYELPVQIPDGLDKRSKLEVTLAPSPAAGLPLVAQNLLDYPWLCLEQQFSRAWVRILRLKHGKLIGLEADQDDMAQIQSAFKRADDFQKYDGGFSMWPGMSGSDFYITAYVLLVNNQAKPLNLGLDPETEKKAWDYLRVRLKDYETSEQAIEAQSLALWLLADHDRDAALALFPGLLKKALSNQPVNPMGWSCLLLTAHELEGLENRDLSISNIMSALEKTAAVTPTQMHFSSSNQRGYWMTMGSTLRDNGLVLAALTRARPEYPRLEALACWLSQGVGEKTYLSTQEAMFGLWGLVSYLESLGGDQDVSVKAEWNGKESVTRSFKKLIDAPASWRLEADKIGGQGSSALSIKANKGNPYWTARLSYASANEAVKQANAGFTVSREWKTPGPWKVGDVVEVEVTLQAHATRRHVFLFDPFPAGLEPLYASRADLADDARQYQYPWQFQEEREDGVFLYAPQVEPGIYKYRYKLRAAAPGVFIQRPSHAEEMYTPEVFGRTGSGQVEVKP